MGFFSKKETKEEVLPTSTAPPKAEAVAAGSSKVEPGAKPKRDGIFCGMSLTEALIALLIFGLFFFFVIWPLITAYFMLACLWLIMWPFVKFIPCCGQHVYVKPLFTVLGVVVTSPIKVTSFLYRTFKYGKEPEGKDGKKATDDPMARAASAAASAAATELMQQKT